MLFDVLCRLESFQIQGPSLNSLRTDEDQANRINQDHSDGVGAVVLLVIVIHLGSEVHCMLLGIGVQIVSYDQAFVASQSQTLSEENVSVPTEESLDFWFGHSGQDATLVGT